MTDPCRVVLLRAPLLIIGLAASGRAFAQTATIEAAPIVVVATTPLPGTSIDADKIAGEVQKLSVPQIAADRRTDVIANLVAGQLASVSLNQEQGSRFQPDFSFRGFTASPVSGVAEGLVVYQDGVRLNEAFGDNVNWDLIPVFAMRDITIQSNNPAFGLNALGGAVTITMKDGLTAGGFAAEVSGGSFGSVAGNAEYGGRFGDFGAYIGVGIQHESGWRYHSPATLRQAYGDLAYEAGKLTLHLSGTAAINDIDAVGPTPVQLLAANPRAVFTYPQSTRNEAELVQLRGTYAASGTLSFNADVHVRRFRQQTLDGNTTDVAACGNAPAQLCLEGAYQFPADALYDSAGAAVPASVLPAGATPGEIDHTHTAATGLGGTLQASLTAPLAGHGNNLTAGASLDHGTTRYQAYGELSVLESDLAVVGSGVIIDQAESPTASPPIEEPVDVLAHNTYVGLYAIDVLDVTRRLSFTLSGRLNTARISLADQTGANPNSGGLNAAHSYARFNPGTGLAWRIARPVTAYVGYSDSNRAPTAGELSCANPASPCPLAAFLVSDPPLQQVVGHSFEAGLRGQIAAAALAGTVKWNVSAFRTLSDNDILLVATRINGFGYFRNAGTTRRQGIDASLRYSGKALRLRLSYSFLDATFRNSLVLASNSPSSDANGSIHVSPGDRIPMNPRHRLTLSADYDLTRSWSLGADLRWQSSMAVAGDESNQQPPLPGYATVNLHTGWQAGKRAEFYADVENLFDKRYYSYGAFAQLGNLPANFDLTDPRTYSPGEPRSVTVGARLKFD